MEPQSKAFTVKAGGTLRVLKTKCAICEAFDPLLGGPPPNIQQVVGLWDTGASGTVISEDCAQRLGLEPTGQIQAYHANGHSTVNTYAINLFLPNQVAFQFVKVSEGILKGTDLLIGMDIISQGDFAITNLGGKTTFSFRMPSSLEIDFVAESNQVKEPFKVSKPPGRNALCSCGSGKKYKHCHGSTKKHFGRK